MKSERQSALKMTWMFDVMLLPAVILTILFAYLPISGLVMAFQDYQPWLGFFRSPWVGLEHFRFLFEREDGPQVIWNTLVISGMKIIAGLAAPLVFALMLNELRQMWLKRSIQTLVYLPHFLSWVIFSGILVDILSVNGIVNKAIVTLFSVKPIAFLSDGTLFRAVAVVSDVWKEFGFGTIIFLAALAGVNPALYEAAEIDGAGRWRMTLSITLPSIMPIIAVLLTLSLGNVLNANFDQIFNLYSPIVYDKGDVIDTFVYRIGILNGELSFGAAMGMFKSVVGFILIVSAYSAAYKWANYRIF